MEFSNFYKNYAINQNDLENILKIYQEVTDKLEEYLARVYHNRFLGKMETYKLIPFQIIAIGSAVYDLENIFSEQSASALFSSLGFPDSIKDRIEYWNTKATTDVKIQILTNSKKYVELSATIYPEGIENYGLSNKFQSVTDVKLYTPSNIELIRGADFEIINNRLFLFGDVSNASINNNQLYAVDINVDFNYVGKALGKNFNIHQYDDISKDEINDIIQNLCVDAMDGFKIKSLNDAMNTIFKNTPGTLVYDMYIRDKSRNSRWNRWSLSPFDFIVEAPEEFSSQSNRIDLMMQYLNTVKPTDSSYIVLLVGIYSDTYRRDINGDSYSADKFAEATQDEVVIGGFYLENGLDRLVNEEGGRILLESSFFDDYTSTILSDSTNLIAEASRKFENWTIDSGASVILTQNQSVSEWNTAEATRIQISGGSAVSKLYYSANLSPSASIAKTSCYVKNIGTKTVKITSVPSNKYQNVSPGQTAIVSIDGATAGSGSTQIRFDALNASDSLDFIAWSPTTSQIFVLNY